jgi:hypothetical protein
MPDRKPKSKAKTEIRSGAGFAAGSSSAVGVGEMRVVIPLPADHPFYAEIGKVAAEWAQFEHILDLIVWDLAKIPQAEGSCITGAFQSYISRFDAINALADLQGIDKKILNQIDTLLRHARGAAKARNRIVHDAWYEEKVTGQLGQFRSQSLKDKQTQRFGIRDIDRKEVEQLLAQIQRRIAEAHELRQEILNRIRR